MESSGLNYTFNDVLRNRKHFGVPGCLGNSQGCEFKTSIGLHAACGAYLKKKKNKRNISTVIPIARGKDKKG